MNAVLEQEHQSGQQGSPAPFLEWLTAARALPPVTAERVARVQAETGDRVCSILLKLGLLSEARLAECASSYSGLPRLTPADIPREPVPLDSINPEFLRAREVVPTGLSDDRLDVACWDPLDDYAVRALEFASGRRAALRVGTREEVRKTLHSLYGGEPGTQTVEETTVGLEQEEVERLKDLASDAPIIRLVQHLIDEAVRLRASDIHIEPSEKALQVRLRLDGLLREFETLPRALAASVISRVKVLAGLDIAERRLPQDGRIRVSSQGKEIDFRVATSPTLSGESVVLRILDRQDVALDFDALGFDPPLIAALRTGLHSPHGILLVTGPTGSGKTTTLYAALKEINTPERKILTVEDPVEYVLSGVNQVPIRPQIGLTFAHALRAFLRQDPDVLMVGEIRDRETAEIAIQAALTGHLLLSTLHTNSAAAAVTRLIDMGIDPFLLTSTLHVVVGQRLVRRLCGSCREPFEPPFELMQSFGAPAGQSEVWHRAGGCPACQGAGFRGRIAIIECLPMTAAIRSQIMARADAHNIERVAVDEGMRTMLLHGLQRVREGITTAEEVLRVTRSN